MTADPVRAIADAVLYEGYILWPYRRSALCPRGCTPPNVQRFWFLSAERRYGQRM